MSSEREQRPSAATESDVDHPPGPSGLGRRDFLRLTGMCLGGAATFGLPGASFASVPSSRGRLAFVLLRGGFDGLAAVAPTFDPAYRRVRGALAADPSELVELEQGFALTPGLAPLRAFWERDELLVLHAMAIPYRTRSHFDGQAVLETGLDQPVGSGDGWLNRLLAVMGGSSSGIGVAAGLPRSLAGPAPVTTWSPAEFGALGDVFLDRLHALYRSDPRLQDRFEAALAQRDLLDSMDGTEPAGEAMGGGGGPGRRSRASAETVFRAAARLLGADGGPNVAALELSGWDTHANQGGAGGTLDRRFQGLADGLTAFRREMGERWPGTTVVVMTEFGRTARPNGSRGTDHGTAGAGFVIGSGIAGSAVVTEWPGLGDRDLFEGRDLAPSLDTRAVLKGVLAGTFDLSTAQVDRVFPGSAHVRGLWRLMA